MSFIPYGKQFIDGADIAAVKEVLKSEWLTQGPAIARFEVKLKETCHANHAVAVSSATAALHIACLALGLGQGDYLWTSANTFVASANCGLYCGALVDFVDIELTHYNMCAKALEKKLIQAEKEGKLPKIVIPVHFAGQSCDMKAIKKLSDKYGFHIIEDASHAIGAYYNDKPVGCGKFSDITVFSFHPVKIVTTGEGGAAVTNSSDLYEKLVRLRTHGITRDANQLQSNHGPWYYEQLDLGYNYRMTDMQAALGCSQLNKLEDFIKKRHNIFNHYASLLKDLPLELPKHNDDSYSALHLYPVLVNDKKKHKLLFEHMRKNNIGVNLHYIPVYKQPYYQQLGFSYDYCPNAEYYYERAVSLPMYPKMLVAEQNVISDTLNQFFIEYKSKVFLD